MFNARAQSHRAKLFPRPLALEQQLLINCRDDRSGQARKKDFAVQDGGVRLKQDASPTRAVAGAPVHPVK